MTDGSEPHPDRSPPARPVRVARFDGFSTDDDPDRAGDARRVADLDGLGEAGRSESKVAEFGALDVPRVARTPVVGLDAVAGRARNRSAGGPADTTPVRRGAGRRPGARRADAVTPDVRPLDADRVAADRVDADRVDADRARSGRSEPAVVPGGDHSDGDGIPPDGPLPRGRRRRARVGRLGPDAPDPDTLEPDADPVAVAREICLRLLTDRARTRQELAQALTRKGVPADAAAAVLDRFDEVGLIDDAAFAGQWVRSRHAQRGLGRRAIAVELRRKGVADDVAREALAEVDAEAEAQRARELVDRKLRSLATDTAEQRAATGRRLVGMLARKGYGAGTAYRVVREALAERGADVDELGTEPAD
jgi:regulatory protein